MSKLTFDFLLYREALEMILSPDIPESEDLGNQK
mgnify:CR=1 FL=1